MMPARKSRPLHQEADRWVFWEVGTGSGLLQYERPNGVGHRGSIGSVRAGRKGGRTRRGDARLELGRTRAETIVPGGADRPHRQTAISFPMRSSQPASLTHQLRSTIQISVLSVDGWATTMNLFYPVVCMYGFLQFLT